MRHCRVIIDMQYGSCGKGLISGFLAEQDKPDTVINANMQNSGHTYINAQGRKFMFKCLPNSIVSPKLEQVLMGPGSVICLDTLIKEVESCADLLKRATLLIHPAALVVTEGDIQAEAVHNRIGSTQTGNSTAMIRRIMRHGDDDPRISEEIHRDALRRLRETVAVSTSREEYAQALRVAHTVQVDGSQGFSLSPYHGFWPYVTSRDCSPAQMCADTGIAIQEVTSVVGCLRTYPIRVANRYDENGKMVGFSGPCYDDQREITFKSIGQETELTTVTQLPRRIFTFSEQQFTEGMEVCRPDTLFVNFCNYLDDKAAAAFLRRIKNYHGGAIFTGWGPTGADVVPF